MKWLMVLGAYLLIGYVAREVFRDSMRLNDIEQVLEELHRRVEDIELELGDD